jgi:hypothetical protein
MNFNAPLFHATRFSGNQTASSSANSILLTNDPTSDQKVEAIPLSNKQKENLQVVHETFEKTAKLAAPNATPEECQAWVAAGDKAMLDTVGIFHKTLENTHDKGSAQMATSNFAANAFIPNLLSTPAGRSFLQKASQNSFRQQSQIH